MPFKCDEPAMPTVQQDGSRCGSPGGISRRERQLDGTATAGLISS